LKLEVSRCLFELLPTVSDARYQATGLLMAKTEFLGQITDLVTLVCGYAAAVGLTAFDFLLAHGHLLFAWKRTLGH
jgi:hypothetical protein